MTIKLPSDFHKPLWDKFNKQQRKAVKQVKGAVQIIAVAGSGKTTVIVHRTEHMINDLEIDPKTIALLTFTSKAAKEMGERLQKLIDKKDYDSMFCGTSHSFGYRVLAKEYKGLNHPLQAFTRKDFKDPGLLTGNALKYFSESVKEKVLALPLENSIIRQVQDIQENQFLKVISLCKNADVDPNEFEEMSLLEGEPTPNKWAYINYYRMYEKMKEQRLCIDFDDMLFKAVRLLRKHPEILRRYQNQYKYVTIDETQDNNKVQYALAEMLALPENNLYVVGDDDQSLYAFNGAEPELFIGFIKKYENAIQIPLEDNYRSKPDILRVANMLISYNKNRIPKQLVAHSKDTEKAVFYSHFPTEIAEAEFVANEIENICNDPNADFMDNIDYKRVFVIYRTNAQNKEMEDALITRGIPYVIHGGMSFYERREVKDILAYLRLANDTDDNEAFKRVYNVPSRYLGKAFLNKIDDNGRNSLWDNMLKTVMTKKEQPGVDNLKSIVNGMAELNKRGAKIEEMINYLLENGYQAHLNKDNKDTDESENNEIIDKIKFFVKRFASIDNLINYVEMMSGKRKENVNGVQLMTVHGSKGLEAHAVFGIGINENLMPHMRSIEAFDDDSNPMAIEEERRLAYVMVTRAESLAYVSSTDSFNGKKSEPSRFIGEMGLRKDTKEYEKEAQEESPITPPTPEPIVTVKETPIKKDVVVDGIGQLSEIPDLVEYIKPEKKKEEVPVLPNGEELDPPPPGYAYADDSYFGKILVPVKKGAVSSKYS